MKFRLIVVAIVALALALTAPIALGSKTKLSGPISGGGKITFKYIRNSAVDKRVGRVTIPRINIECNGTPYLMSLTITGQTPIDSKRKFKLVGKGNSGQSHSKVTGKFKKNFHRASGKIRLWGTFNPSQGLVNCETGREDWSAKR